MCVSKIKCTNLCITYRSIATGLLIRLLIILTRKYKLKFAFFIKKKNDSVIIKMHEFCHSDTITYFFQGIVHTFNLN